MACGQLSDALTVSSLVVTGHHRWLPSLVTIAGLASSLVSRYSLSLFSLAYTSLPSLAASAIIGSVAALPSVSHSLSYFPARLHPPTHAHTDVPRPPCDCSYPTTPAGEQRVINTPHRQFLFEALLFPFVSLCDWCGMSVIFDWFGCITRTRFGSFSLSFACQLFFLSR